MDKKQLAEVVEIVYGMWNKELPVNIESRKLTFRAWQLLLGDLEEQDIIDAAKRLAQKEHFLPTPGMLVTEHRRFTTKEPTPHQAWSHYTHIRDAVNSGTTQYSPPHPRLQKTIQQVGLNLHTNDDRKHFIEIYTTLS
jgi:hypothetical protein